MNTVRIEKKKKITDLRINGFRLPGVLDYKIKTNSVTNNTELVLTLDVSELIVYIKE